MKHSNGSVVKIAISSFKKEATTRMSHFIMIIFLLLLNYCVKLFHFPTF